MIIYNVTIKVENQIANEWLEWMKQEHIPELMQTGLFIDARLCKLLEQDETEGITYIAQYFCKDIEAYNSYISDHAGRMRDKSFTRFGNKFIAFRTLMQVEI
jgi:hypothetical protein